MSKQTELNFFATARRRAAFPVCCFSSTEKAEALRPAPHCEARRRPRVARDLIGLPETSVRSSRARAPEARLGLRAPRAIRKAALEKFVPGDNATENSCSDARASAVAGPVALDIHSPRRATRSARAAFHAVRSGHVAHRSTASHSGDARRTRALPAFVSFLAV